MAVFCIRKTERKEHLLMIYLLIFSAKLLEVSISTIRVVLMARGSKIASSLLAVLEVTIWVIVTSTVLLSLQEDPMRAVAFIAAFAVGVFLGVLVEDKMALGLSQIEIIAEYDEAKIITKKLRDHGYRATTYVCEGLNGRKLSINLKVLRRDVPSTIEILNEHDEVFVTVMDIRKISIGNIVKSALMKTN